MSRRHPAALMTLLALTVTLPAAAQQDQRTISADSIKLHHDIALRDSVRSALEADHDRIHADQARLDSLRPALAAARKATPRDPAAIKRDLAALDRANAALDRDLDQGKREEVRLAALKKRADQESDALEGARKDLRADRSGQKQANGPRDARQDARALSADSTTLRRDIAMRDSARSALEADHDRIHADQGRLDSLKTALAHARKADRRDGGRAPRSAVGPLGARASVVESPPPVAVRRPFTRRYPMVRFHSAAVAAVLLVGMTSL